MTAHSHAATENLLRTHRAGTPTDSLFGDRKTAWNFLNSRFLIARKETMARRSLRRGEPLRLKRIIGACTGFIRGQRGGRTCICDRWRTPGFGTDKHVLHIGHAKQFDLGRTQADS